MYIPNEEILNKYADVLINFALNSGKGIKKGETALLQVPECAKPILAPLRRAVLKAGANAIIEYLPDGLARDFYELASDKQLEFFPSKYLKGKVDDVDHFVMIIAESDKKELEGIDPKKIMKRSLAMKDYRKWRDEKEYAGKLTWTLALYGTEAMAREAGMSLENYWKEIIKGCYLDEENPVEKWEDSFKEIERVKSKLNSMEIEKVRVKADGTDLIVGLGEDRKWLGGDGRNIPSYEVFISPDWRVTEGDVKFTEPLYRYGNLMKGVRLKFEKGKVVEAHADEGEEFLKEMIATEDADKIGEFSLTDSRLSRIDKFMAETLFDENVGGKYGNMHIAVGMAYKDSYPGDVPKVSEKKWKEMGYNDSVVHTDIVSTADKEVIAYLKDGSEKVIYKSGKFVV